MSIPLAIVSASFVTVVELVGGTLLILGLLTTVVAGLMGVVMAGAAAFVHAGTACSSVPAAGSSSARSPARCWRWPRRARAGSASRTWCGRGPAAPRRPRSPPPAGARAGGGHPAARTAGDAPDPPRARAGPVAAGTPGLRRAGAIGPRRCIARRRPCATSRSRRVDGELGQGSERGHADGVGFRLPITGGSSAGEPHASRRRRATSRSWSPGCCSARSCSRTATRSS